MEVKGKDGYFTINGKKVEYLDDQEAYKENPEDYTTKKFRMTEGEICLDICEHTGKRIGSSACYHCKDFRGVSYQKLEMKCRRGIK